uniref:Uncharacterized protein n=1 Tax=Rhizophora mucronata TaxID=61149 RepID=A0A2P2R2X9_RHIMU
MVNEQVLMSLISTFL